MRIMADEAFPVCHRKMGRPCQELPFLSLVARVAESCPLLSHKIPKSRAMGVVTAKAAFFPDRSMRKDSLAHGIVTLRADAAGIRCDGCEIIFLVSLLRMTVAATIKAEAAGMNKQGPHLLGRTGSSGHVTIDKPLLQGPAGGIKYRDTIFAAA